MTEETLGFSFPLEDLLLSRRFGDGASKATAGRYFGLEPILGVMCHHVSFRNQVVDWQAWIEDGAVPLVRKAVIDFKNEPGSPRWTALLNKWDLETPLPDSSFSPILRLGRSGSNSLELKRSKLRNDAMRDDENETTALWAKTVCLCGDAPGQADGRTDTCVVSAFAPKRALEAMHLGTSLGNSQPSLCFVVGGNDFIADEDGQA